MLRAAFTSALHGPAVQAWHSKTAWLLRFSGATCPHAEHRCDVYAAGMCSIRPKALCCNRAASRPHPLRLMARLRPRFCATRRPGCSMVPRALRVMARTSRASMRIVSKRRAISVVVFSTQSFRRSRSRAFSLAMASFVPARRFEPRSARARRCCSTFNRFDSPGVRAGAWQQFTGGQCRRHRNTTVDTHHGAIAGTSDRVGDVGERDMPAAGPIAGDPVGLHTLSDGARQAEAHPPDLGHPDPTETAVQTLDVVRFHSDLPEALMHTGFSPRRAAMRSGEKTPHRLGEVPQRLLLHSLGASSQPIMFGTRRSQLSTLLVISRRAATGLPVQLLFDGQVPHKPGMATMLCKRHRLLSGWKQTVTRHPRNVTATTDKSRKETRRFLPWLKPEVSTPQQPDEQAAAAHDHRSLRWLAAHVRAGCRCGDRARCAGRRASAASGGLPGSRAAALPRRSLGRDRQRQQERNVPRAAAGVFRGHSRQRDHSSRRSRGSAADVRTRPGPSAG